MSEAQQKQPYNPASVTIVSHLCDGVGQLTVKLRVIHSVDEKFEQGGACGQGLVVDVNSNDVPPTETSVIEDPTGVFTRLYDAVVQLSSGDPYTIKANFHYVVHGSAPEMTATGNC